MKHILMLSGGSDSVLCFYLLLYCKIDFVCVHINHGIRVFEDQKTGEAFFDEEFVKKLCRHFNVRLIIKRVRLKLAKKTSENSARRIRKRVAKRVLENIEKVGFTTPKNQVSLSKKEVNILRESISAIKTANGSSVITGHNLNDFFETTLYNMLRGSKDGWINGIQKRSDIYLRPILYLEKNQINEAVQSVGAEFFGKKYVTDSTNSDTNYTRNKIRHLEPLLRGINQNYIKNFYKAVSGVKEMGLGNQLYEEVEVFGFLTKQQLRKTEDRGLRDIALLSLKKCNVEVTSAKVYMLVRFMKNFDFVDEKKELVFTNLRGDKILYTKTKSGVNMPTVN